MKATFIFDLHGVLTRGAEVLHGAASAVRGIQSLGCETGFLTNSSSSSPEEVAQMLSQAGIPCTPCQVMTAGWATGLWMRSRHAAKRPHILVCGQPGLRRLIRRAFPESGEVDVDSGPYDYVVVGRDPEFDWTRLNRVWRAVTEGAVLVTPSTDRVVPGSAGDELGPGPLVACVEAATKQRATVIGKPSTIALELLLQQLDSRGRVWVVGDTAETDIALGVAARCGSVLVRTGNGPEYRPGVDPRPDRIVDDVSHLYQLIRESSKAEWEG